MNLEKIREMTETELNNELKKMKNELFNLRFQHVTGQLENPIKLRNVKRDIARVKTIMREKELVKAQSIG
ncbi:MAG: 50S ribosomal protein L29 [Clostridiales Family XIII bacterium]|jgi:large subunit ribosomal protein L29|nr:50S ribosomal protein L29 [Clostridiales Family XIII bacterium]